MGRPTEQGEPRRKMRDCEMGDEAVDDVERGADAVPGRQVLTFWWQVLPVDRGLRGERDW
jgi:hypothetical protein